MVLVLRRRWYRQSLECTAADEVPSSSLAQLVADKSTGTVSYKQREKTTSLGHPQKFVKALSLLMNGFAFVCITIMADVAHWSGEALHGVVRGRKQEETKFAIKSQVRLLKSHQHSDHVSERLQRARGEACHEWSWGRQARGREHAGACVAFR